MSNSNVGGLAGADALCQNRAAAGDLPGTYHAWLSDSTASPRTRFRCAQARCSSEGYIRVDGEVIATGWDDLTDGALAVPISITELNQADADNPSDIWTHTNPDGSAVASANHCQDWTSSSPDDDGHDGDSSLSDTRWTNEGPIGCNVPRRLYCFQQT